MFLLKFGDFLVSNSVWFPSSMSFLQLTTALVNAIGIMYSIWVDSWGTIFAFTTTKLQRYRGWSGSLRTLVHSQYSGSSLTSQFKLPEEATWLNWRWDVIDFPTRGETQKKSKVATDVSRDHEKRCRCQWAHNSRQGKKIREGSISGWEGQYFWRHRHNISFRDFPKYPNQVLQQQLKTSVFYSSWRGLKFWQRKIFDL